MFIRYTTLRNILVVVAILAVGTVLVLWAMSPDDDDSDDDAPRSTEASSTSPSPETSQARRASPPATTSTPSTPSTSSPSSTPTADVPYADVAEMILNERATEKKIKDLNSGRGAKINLYDDDQDGQWDRAKIDADRDDEDDEKWTFKEGRVERRILADDTRFIYAPGEGWRPKE